MLGGTAAAVFGSFLPTIPLILVLLVGLGIAITSWSSYPRVAMLVTIALGLELLATLLGIAFSGSIPLLLAQGNLTSRQFGPLALLVGVVLRLLSAAAWVLVLSAVFTGRSGGHPDGRGARSER
jgi:hypothetical protein